MYNKENWFEEISKCDTCGQIRKIIDIDNAPFEHRKWAKANTYFWVFYCQKCEMWGDYNGI